MKIFTNLLILLLAAAFTLSSCKKKIKQQEDEIYSRHLQEHIKLTIISTPMPDDKGKMNLLLLNDGQFNLPLQMAAVNFILLRFNFLFTTGCRNQ